MPDDLPAPLTPPDCDLRGLPFMPLDVVRLVDSDFVAKTNGDEFKAGVLLWSRSWNQIPAASLPDDDDVLAHLSNAHRKWKKVKAKALHGWIKCSDGRLYHPVVAEKAREAWDHRLSQRARAAKRWHGHTTSTGTATGYPSADATGDATAYPTAMQGTGTVKGQREEKPPNPHLAMGEQDQSSIEGRKGLRANGTNPRALAAAAEAAKPPPPEPSGPVYAIIRRDRHDAAEFYRAWLTRCAIDEPAKRIVAPSAFVAARIKAECAAILDPEGWRVEAAA